VKSVLAPGGYGADDWGRAHEHGLVLDVGVLVVVGVEQANAVAGFVVGCSEGQSHPHSS
jgi:hypothetical protein